MVAIGAGVFFLTKGSDSGGGSLDDDGKTYKLTAPATVAGDYTKNSERRRRRVSTTRTSRNRGGWGVQNPREVTAGYKQGSD